MDEDMDLNEMPEDSFNAQDMGADDTAYAPHKEGEEKDLTQDGGVKKLLVKAGEGWDKPETGDEVEVHYTGTLLDGTKFDSSVDRNEPFTFKLGQGNVIKGWDKGVATMKKNEKCVLTITAPYAYGDAGSPPTIPGGATLKFEVELLSWKSIKDICGDGGIIKTLVAEGKKWESPKLDDEVKIQYEVKLPDGTVVDKSPEEGVEYKLKDGHLCPAIGEVLKTMHRGEQVSLSVKPRYGFGDKGREAKGAYPAIPANSNLDISLTLSGWISVEKVTDDWKVKKKSLKEGEGYEKPNEMAKVKVRYTAKLANGKVFEKKGQEVGQEFEFVIDEEHVIPGLDKAVLKMKKGETALVSVASEYGYGAQEYAGELAVVPPNSDLEYEVELVSFEKAKESWDMDSAEKLEAAGKRKEEGNALYKLGKHDRASKKYAKGVKLIEYDSQFSDEEKKQSKVLQVSCNLNDAACQLKLGSYKEAEKLCTKVLDKESQNVKALFRRAQAYMGSQDYEEAGVDIKKALEIDPNNRDVKVEQKLLRQKVAEANKKEAKIYGNMFARLSKMEEKETKTTNTNGHATLEEVGEEKAEAAPEPMAVEGA